MSRWKKKESFVYFLSDFFLHYESSEWLGLSSTCFVIISFKCHSCPPPSQWPFIMYFRHTLEGRLCMSVDAYSKISIHMLMQQWAWGFGVLAVFTFWIVLCLKRVYVCFYYIVRTMAWKHAHTVGTKIMVPAMFMHIFVFWWFDDDDDDFLFFFWKTPPCTYLDFCVFLEIINIL